FTKQRAYFIRDLVRKRIFAERGVVRPTPLRYARARRNAWLGYGFAGALTVATFVALGFYVPVWSEEANYYKAATDTTSHALEAIAKGPDYDLKSVLT